MAGVQLFSHQIEALQKMKNGCILCGDVGSGKSITGLSYYYEQNGGKVNTTNHIRMNKPCDLYIITTARKRDTKEWEKELLPFYLSTDDNLNYYKNKVRVDSWNNIGKYIDVKDSFFIFDEQRVVGYGAWTKSFLKIAAKNKWILLTATPGDTWSDYIPVFIANGFFRNKTDFNSNHVVFNPYVQFPSIQRYINEGYLIQLRSKILIPMVFKRKTIPHHETIICEYDRYNYDFMNKNRWNIYTSLPIKNVSEYCSCLRKLVNSDPSRQQALLDIIAKHNKIILFYNYDFELEILRKLLDGLRPYAEWNGHKHQPIPETEKWVYLVQYFSGNEGWNCTETDTMVFYSQNYSYKVMVQAAGRIDRINTPYIDLYYYHLKSNSRIDKAINFALNKKKKFNEKNFAPKDLPYITQKEKTQND